MVEETQSGMRDIGIAIGKNKVGVVIIEKEKVVFSQSYTFSKEEIEKLEVLINKITRELSIEKEDNIYLSLPEKNIILRSFSLPLMGKRELEGGVHFEVEKYLPFSVEELVWSYNYQKIWRERKIIVSFLGMRKEEFVQIKEVFSELKLNLFLVEPHFFSLLRLIKGKKEYSKDKGIAILDLTSSECSLTFFFKDVAFFTHSFSVEKFSEEEAVLSFLKEKIVEEIRLSFRYFQRDFSSFSLKKLIIIAHPFLIKEDFFSSLEEDLGVKVVIISPMEIVPLKEVNSEILNAYGAVKTSYFGWQPVYKWRDISGVIYERRKEPLLVFVGKGVGIGLLFILLLNSYLQGKINKVENSLREKRAKLTSQKKIFREMNIKDLEKLIKNKENDIKRLKERKNTEFSPLFESMVENLPLGGWLEKIEIDSEKGKMVISGYIYSENYVEEVRELYEFIAHLKEEERIRKAFSHIDVIRKENKVMEGFGVVYFEILLSS